ncbi:DsrE family protein [Christiangramia portivictoriae]|uniref:DsrE family protein n=1 Tax=Christiangramia portivictoriae TaxID=326069 RepID=UPI0003F8D032|nr:DsrE family protein [Christiangramia portivictoriae]
MKKLITLLSILLVNLSFSQQFETGNVIADFGKTVAVPHAKFEVDTSLVYKVVFDIDRNFNPSEVNKLAETAARFLNMHEKAGVDPENIHIALVFHGSATKDVLDDFSYTKAYPDTKNNPNTPLLTALANAGVELILCGQSAAYHNLKPEDVHKDVKYALSAMTALVQLQANDYQLIKF